MPTNQIGAFLVKNGTVNKLTTWVLTATNVYTQMPNGGARYQVLLNHGDYLACHPIKADGTVNIGVTVNVMKPWTLRRTPFDGILIDGVTCTYSDDATRSATDGTSTETQKITPTYTPGDMICVEALWPPETISGSPVRLIDSNMDGRAWAAS